MTALGRPPEVGDEVVYGEVRFTVVTVEGLAVSRVRIFYPEPAPGEGSEEE